jgi:asparagine synthase (glutamine-hydrolysing)
MKNWLRARRQRADWGIVASPDLLAEAAPRFASYREASLFRSYLDDGRERWFLPGFLHYDDHNAMSFGLEARAPFLDRRIVEWGIGARPADLVDRGLGKLALRGLARDLLPRQVVENPTKRGLPAPAARWLLENPDFVMDTLAATRLDGIRTGVVAARFRDAAGAGVIDAATLAATWRVLSLAVWAERTGAAL